MQTSIFDVAAYIRDHSGKGLTTMKLQKLCYYVKAWSLGQRNDPIFPEQFQAWKDGPVSRSLYSTHAKSYTVPTDWNFGDARNLSPEDMSLIDAVIEAYEPHSGDRLGQMTHEERPWIDARGELPDGAHSEAEISERSIKRYFAKQALQGRSPLKGGARQVSSNVSPAERSEMLYRQLTRWSGVNKLLETR